MGRYQIVYLNIAGTIKRELISGNECLENEDILKTLLFIFQKEIKKKKSKKGFLLLLKDYKIIEKVKL